MNLNPLAAVEGIVKAGGGIVKSIWGDKSAVEAGDHESDMATIGQFTAEFQHAPRNWFDSLVNGLNRLPRPMMVFGVFGMLAYCPYDPVGFAIIMQAFEVVPIWLAAIAGTIVTFYFTTRHREEMTKIAGPSPDKIKAIVEARKQLVELRRKVANEDEPQITEDEFKRQMVNEDEPLSNAAIAEWNRRRQGKAA